MTEKRGALEELFRIREAKARPVRAYLELTAACQFRCTHCFIKPAQSETELTSDEWLEVMKQLRAMGVLALTFSGGEFLVRRDWRKIAEQAGKMRFALRFLTNGALIDEKTADEIAAVRPLRIEVSIYGTDPETYEAVTGNADNYRRALRGIARLKSRGLRIVIKYPLLKSTWRKYDDALEIARKYNVPLWYDYHLVPAAASPDEPNTEVLGFSELREFFEEHRSEENESSLLDPDTPICDIARRGIVISAHGQVFPCPRFRVSAGSVHEKPVAEIWTGSELLTELRDKRTRDMETCNACEHRAICRSCPAHGYAEHGNMTEPAAGDCLATLAASTAGSV
ncbi:MAG: radical SAM protein [Planctomycetota bacterium]|jgi:radical SAM protein with 4Fe4S-binding SPASM domain